MTSRNFEHFFNPFPQSSPFLLLRSWYYCHKILDPLPPDTVTSLMDDPLGIRCYDVIGFYVLGKYLKTEEKKTIENMNFLLFNFNSKCEMWCDVMILTVSDDVTVFH